MMELYGYRLPIVNWRRCLRIRRPGPGRGIMSLSGRLLPFAPSRALCEKCSHKCIYLRYLGCAKLLGAGEVQVQHCVLGGGDFDCIIITNVFQIAIGLVTGPLNTEPCLARVRNWRLGADELGWRARRASLGLRGANSWRLVRCSEGRRFGCCFGRALNESLLNCLVV